MVRLRPASRPVQTFCKNAKNKWVIPSLIVILLLKLANFLTPLNYQTYLLKCELSVNSYNSSSDLINDTQKVNLKFKSTELLKEKSA